MLRAVWEFLFFGQFLVATPKVQQSGIVTARAAKRGSSHLVCVSARQRAAACKKRPISQQPAAPNLSLHLFVFLKTILLFLSFFDFGQEILA
jgi:hypothetical protein